MELIGTSLVEVTGVEAVIANLSNVGDNCVQTRLRPYPSTRTIAVRTRGLGRRVWRVWRESGVLSLDTLSQLGSGER